MNEVGPTVGEWRREHIGWPVVTCYRCGGTVWRSWDEWWCPRCGTLSERLDPDVEQLLRAERTRGTKAVVADVRA